MRRGKSKVEGGIMRKVCIFSSKSFCKHVVITEYGVVDGTLESWATQLD